MTLRSVPPLPDDDDGRSPGDDAELDATETAEPAVPEVWLPEGDLVAEVSSEPVALELDPSLFEPRIARLHPAAWIVGGLVIAWAIVFGSLGVQNQRNFGTWSYDMGIYDQAIWLVSQGGNTFMSVRGLDVWGHHVNLIFYALVPLYWLGAGPSTLYVVQAICLALGAVPTYLIARDLFKSSWMGLCFAVVYLCYAPVNWISWAMFHPEALVITPLLFAWWFATRQRWGWFFAMVVLALSTREDTALAIIMMGVVLAVHLRRADNQVRVRWMCGATVALGAAWYLIATRVVIPHFNDGEQPFYITYFYGNYGKSIPEIVGTMIRHPSRVIADAIEADRLKFYSEMSWPLGWVYLANPLGLLIALPQLLASVIGLSPYARMIKYQYTSIMIAPMIIASISGARMLWRFRVVRLLLPVWLIGCAVYSNMELAPSPIGKPAVYAYWSKPSPRNASLNHALELVPDDASVSATYQLLPHMSHRRHIYDWPNPFVPNVWGNDNCRRLPDPRTIDYLVLDLTQIGPSNQTLFDGLTAVGGPFETVFEDANVIVAKRVGTDPAVDEQPQSSSCRTLEQRYAAG